MTIFERAKELAIIQSTASVVGWDQETYLPNHAHSYRAKQLEWLSAQAHSLATSPDWQASLEAAIANDDLSNPTTTANLRELHRQFSRAAKLPVTLVAKESAASSLAKHAWADAREKSDFSLFAPHLDSLVQIAREKAELWGYAQNPYDALIDGYERGATADSISQLFSAITPSLRAIAQRAVEKSSHHPIALPAGPYPIAAQQQLNHAIAESIGFDFSAGRIDTTTHPFCTTLGPRDVRLTTRYDESDFTSSLFGVLHEAGHGLYEQGLPADDFGLPSGTSVSLGIHESQSRLWENHVGRSPAFWHHWYPIACSYFPQLQSFPLDHFLQFIHRSSFSPIRVEADEATYDLHIILRFELELQLIQGSLKVRDLPDAWNQSFLHSFGFLPQNDREGCLQDIHWSMGGIGYFPTYTLGNLHSALLFATAMNTQEIASAAAHANYRPLLSWLNQHVHAFGATLDPSDLILKATQQAPSPDAYLSHLSSRYL